VVSPFSGDPRILFIGVWLLLARLSTNKNDWRLDLSTTTRQTDIITGLCLLTAARFLHYSVHTAHFRHSINNLRNNALTLLVGRQEGNPACKKTELWGAGVVICLEWGADLHMAQQLPLPLTVSCFSKIQIGFTFLVPAHPGGPRQRAVKRECVCVFSKTIWMLETCLIILYSIHDYFYSSK